MSPDIRLSYRLLPTEESSHVAESDLSEYGIVSDLYENGWHNWAECELILLNGLTNLTGPGPRRITAASPWLRRNMQTSTETIQRPARCSMVDRNTAVRVPVAILDEGVVDCLDTRDAKNFVVRGVVPRGSHTHSLCTFDFITRTALRDPLLPLGAAIVIPRIYKWSYRGWDVPCPERSRRWQRRWRMG